MTLRTCLSITALHLAFLSILATNTADAQAPLCPSVITFNGDNIRYCRNKAIGTVDANVTRAVIVVHGDGRNAQQYYNDVYNNAPVGRRDSNLIIVAPQFITTLERDAYGLGPTYEVWSDDGWKHGHRAANSQRLSSYAWLDRIVNQLLSNMPNLEHIVVIGFSAGGQFVNKYSATTGIVQTAESNAVTMTFGVGAPSLYLWTTSSRPVWIGEATGYNDYPYGLDNRDNVAYVASLSNDTIRGNLYWRSIYYFVGDLDTGTNNLAQNQAANLQGSQRRDRAINYHQHLLGAFDFDYPFFILPSIGHSFTDAATTAEVRDIMFNWGAY
jgi:hypothetical protein